MCVFPSLQKEYIMLSVSFLVSEGNIEWLQNQL